MTTLKEYIDLVMADIPDKAKVTFDLIVNPMTVTKNKVKTTELNVARYSDGGNRIKFSIIKNPDPKQLKKN